MKLSIVNLKNIKQTRERVTVETTKFILKLKQNLAPFINILWQNKFVLISVINAIVAGSLAISLSIRLAYLVKGNNYWWSIGEQSGIASDNHYDYYRSIAQNNIPVVFIALIFSFLLLFQTFRILTRARNEKWDKRSKRRWLRQTGLLVYSVLVVFLAIVFIS